MEPRDTLSNVYLFRDATPQDLGAVAAIAEPKAYMVGEYVYRSGDASDAFFVVESGTIDVILKDKDICLGSVGAGQALGEMAFFERAERLASAITRERTHLLRLPFVKLDQVFGERATLAAAFYRHTCTLLARQLRTLAPDLDRRYF